MNRSQIRKAIKKVAKNNHVTTAEVRQEIQAAINAAYRNPTPAALAIPRKGDAPTAEKLIGCIAEQIIIEERDKNQED